MPRKSQQILWLTKQLTKSGFKEVVQLASIYMSANQERMARQWFDANLSCQKSAKKSFSPNSVPTLRDSYGSSKDPCLITVLHLGPNIFPENSDIKYHKMFLMTCRSAFQLRGLTPSMHCDPGHRHFSWEFSPKVALVKCPCAFRLRRLAQQSALRSCAPAFLLRILAHSACCQECILTAQARTQSASRSWSLAFYL